MSEQKIIWNSNFTLLKSMFPDFENDILPQKDNQKHLAVHTTRSGEIWAEHKGHAICSRHNPQREAERIVATGISSTPGCIVAIHAGLGYRISAIRKKFPHTPLIIVEPDIPLFLETCEYIDFSSVLNSPEVTLLLGASPETVLTVLGNLQFIGSLEVLVHRGLTEKDSTYTNTLLAKLTQFSSRKEVNNNTLKRFGKIWLKNLFTNINQFSSVGSLNTLFNIVGDIPVVVLAAGPSLDLLKPHIHKIKKRCVIVAVDTAAGWCRLNGITPDFMVVIDPQFWNTRHLDRINWPSILISESSTHPRVFRLHSGPVYFCASLFPLGRFFDAKAGITGELGAGGSVSTSAWDFAHYISRGPVYIAGLDLGFPNKKTHYKGSFFEERAHLLSSRLTPASSAHFHALRDGSPFGEKNNMGGETLTDRRLIVYKWWFENQISARKSETSYTLSPGAIAIQGLPYSEIEQIIALPVQRPKIDRILSAVKNPAVDRENNILELNDLIIGLQLLQKTAANGATTAEDIINKSCSAPPQLQQSIMNKGIRILSEIDAKISSSEYKDIAGFLLQEITDDLSKQNDPFKTSLLLYSHLESSLDYQLKLLLKNKKN